MIHVIRDSGDLLYFLIKNKLEIDTIFKERGALLFSGFKPCSISSFQKISESFCKQLADYQYGSSPRNKLGGNIYTSTEYPRDRVIPLHNENSYARKWPKKILFYCVIPPTSGGETPIANSSVVYNLIPQKIRDKFEKNKLMYVRNYGFGMDLSWQKTFETTAKKSVEDFCMANDIDYRWLANDCLQTRQICQSSLIHPEKQCVVWFNQAHLFHQSANDIELQNYFKDKNPMTLPRNVFFGDGSQIGEDDLSEVRNAYAKAEESFAWKKGDLMILDNVLYCHGRRAFEGDRKINVSMGD